MTSHLWTEKLSFGCSFHTKLSQARNSRKCRTSLSKHARWTHQTQPYTLWSTGRRVRIFDDDATPPPPPQTSVNLYWQMERETPNFKRYSKTNRTANLTFGVVTRCWKGSTFCGYSNLSEEKPARVAPPPKISPSRVYRRVAPSSSSLDA